MKKIFLFLVLSILIATVFLIWRLPVIAQEKALAYFRDNGSSSVSIETTRVGLNAIHFHSIMLDQEKISSIDQLDITLDWITYLLKGRIDTVRITGYSYDQILSDVDLVFIARHLNLSALKDLKIDTLIIDGMQFNLATDIGAIRIEGKCQISSQSDDTLSIQSLFWAKQFQLGFQIPLSGIMRPDGSFVFESNFNDGKINIGPFRISRLTGWASLEGKDNAVQSFSAQLDAGSAEILNLPLNDLSLAFSESPDSTNGIFRAKVTGLHSGKISGDLNYTEETQRASLSLTLEKESDSKTFFTHLYGKDRIKNFSPLSSQAQTVSLTYLPERRFVGGPFPFVFSNKVGKESTEALSGNILLYPENWQIKGTIFGKENNIQALKTMALANSDLDKGIVDQSEKNKADSSESKILDFSLRNWFIKTLQSSDYKQ